MWLTLCIISVRAALDAKRLTWFAISSTISCVVILSCPHFYPLVCLMRQPCYGTSFRPRSPNKRLKVHFFRIDCTSEQIVTESFRRGSNIILTYLIMIFSVPKCLMFISIWNIMLYTFVDVDILLLSLNSSFQIYLYVPEASVPCCKFRSPPKNIWVIIGYKFEFHWFE